MLRLLMISMLFVLLLSSNAFATDPCASSAVEGWIRDSNSELDKAVDCIKQKHVCCSTHWSAAKRYYKRLEDGRPDCKNIPAAVSLRNRLTAVSAMCVKVRTGGKSLNPNIIQNPAIKRKIDLPPQN